ncbi:hypothetical protein QMZ05_13885 [Bradyrhizobium sp. INPA03-11B]|uniref:hypothetical protein n=1 Tax=Bradyrhizobium sp. INPA03-11B TaxID=418598 RepID=UPI0033905FEB
MPMMVMTAARFSSRRDEGQEHGDSRESFTHYKVLLLLADHPGCGGRRSDDLRFGCEATASAGRRKTEAGRGPPGPLRNGLWPKYDGIFRQAVEILPKTSDAGHATAAMFCARLNSLAQR